MAEPAEAPAEMDKDLEVVMWVAGRLDEGHPTNTSSVSPALRRVVRRFRELEAEVTRLRNTLAEGAGDDDPVCIECGRPIDWSGRGPRPGYHTKCRWKASNDRRRHAS